MVVKRRDGPRRLRELDDDDDDDDEFIPPRQTRHRQDCLVVSGASGVNWSLRAGSKKYITYRRCDVVRAALHSSRRDVL